MVKNSALFIGSRYASFGSHNQLVGFISLLSVLGLALGVAILITVLSVMNGFDREMQQRILALVPHITVTSARNEALRSEAEWQPLLTSILATPGVRAAAPWLQLQGMLLADGRRAKGILLNGIDPAQEQSVSIIGDFLQGGTLDQLQGGAYSIAIGAGLAEALDVGIGDEVMLVSTYVPISPMGNFPRQKRFTVTAIFAVGSQLDRNLALVHIEDAQALYRLGGIHGYRVQTDDLFNVFDIGTALRETLPGGLSFSDWTNSYGNIYENIRLSKTLVGFLLSLLVAVAAFNVIVSLIMVVREKQGDIAILRTMGTSLGTIRSIFLVQGFIIGIIGTGLGLVLGLLFSLVAGDFVAWLEVAIGIDFLSSEVYPVDYLPTEIRAYDVALVCVMALTLSLLATLYPAARAASIRPAEILRYE